MQEICCKHLFSRYDSNAARHYTNLRMQIYISVGLLKLLLFVSFIKDKTPFHRIRGIEPRATPTPKVGACLRPMRGNNAVGVFSVKTLFYCIQGFEPCKLSGYEPAVSQ